MLVRRCGLTRPDDLVGLRGVEHMQFPRRHKPLEARIRRPLDRRHRPLRPAPATPGSRARTLPAPSNRTDTTAPQPWAIPESAGTSFLTTHGGFWAYLGCTPTWLSTRSSCAQRRRP